MFQGVEKRPYSGNNGIAHVLSLPKKRLAGFLR